MALRQTSDAFDQRGVRFLLLKGPAFSRWLYDAPGERMYRDIDLLVEPGCMEAADEALVELGFERPLSHARAAELPVHHERWLRRAGVPAVVELHHTLVFLCAPPSVVWARLSKGSGQIEVARARMRVPSETGSALIVVLHAAQHGIGDVRHMEDLRRALERVEERSWREAAALAHELGASEAFATGLRLLPAGRELADHLGLHVSAARFVRLAASTPPDTAAGIERLITTPGLVGRLRLIGRELAPSRAWMRSVYPLARRGEGGLALAYLMRPLLLAINLPRGCAAWLRIAIARRSGLYRRGGNR